jgi:hypothetical protein
VVLLDMNKLLAPESLQMRSGQSQNEAAENKPAVKGEARGAAAR